MKELQEIPVSNDYAIIDSEEDYVKHGNQLLYFPGTIDEKLKQTAEIVGVSYINQKSRCFIDDTYFFATNYYTDEEKTKTSATIGTAKLPLLEDIRFLYTIPETQSVNGSRMDVTCKIFYDFILFETENDCFVVEKTTLKTTEIFAGDYHKLSAKNALVFALCSVDESGEGLKTTTFRVYDENLTEYSVTVSGFYQEDKPKLLGKYLFFDYGSHYKQCVHVETGEYIENVWELYEELNNGNETTRTDESTLNLKNGDYTYYTNYNEDQLHIKNLQTEEETVLTVETLLANSPDLQKIMEIFSTLDFLQALDCDGELLVVLYNTSNFFGGMTADSAPRLIFRCDLQSKSLTYINYVRFSFSPVRNVMKIT